MTVPLLHVQRTVLTASVGTISTVCPLTAGSMFLRVSVIRPPPVMTRLLTYVDAIDASMPAAALSPGHALEDWRVSVTADFAVVASINASDTRARIV